MVPTDDGASPAPLDRAVMDRLQSRFDSNPIAASAELVEQDTPHLRVTLSSEYYPAAVTARIEVRWYRNDDFSIHYREHRDSETWECRWDRHPNPHNTRSHFHPPPTASLTAATDEGWPADHRDMCGILFDYLDDRIETLWA